MKRFLELCKSYIMDWGGVGTLLRRDRAYFEVEMRLVFDRAKHLSDFIGMVVQLTFLMVFVAYFVAKSKSSTSWWWGSVYSSTAGAGVYLHCILCF
jgi:hypothetical protein